MSTFITDLRYAVRMLLKSPGFTLIAVVALALGIGANTAIFSVVNAVLLRPLPYKAPEELVWLWGTNPQNDIKQETASYPDFNDWRQQAQSFNGMAGFASSAPILGGTEGEPERLRAGVAIGDLFSVLGVEPALGRKFLPEENEEGKHRVVLLSHALWQRRFGGDPGIVSRQVMINNNQHTIVGVLPAAFQDPLPGEAQRLEMWLPLSVTANMKQARRGDFLNVVARLKPGTTRQQAEAEMTGITAQLEKQYPNTNTGWGIIVQSMHETITGDVRPALLVLLGAVSVLLLIACANVANLLLARATARQREIAIRAALGASRGRIIGQLLTENVLLSLCGGVLGLLFAYWGMDALLALNPGNIPRLDSIGIDRAVLLFTIGVSLVTGLVFGLAPALTVSKPQFNDTLKDGGRGGMEGGTARRLRSGLAVAEIALSFVLLVGAGLLIRSFLQLQDVNPGFSADHLLTVNLSLPAAKYPENQQVVNLYDQLLARLAVQPGVQSATVTTALPLAGGSEYAAFTVEGRIPARTDRQPDAESRIVGPDYFRALQIPLRKGRLLEERDATGAPDVVVINETMTRKYFGGDDPIGKRITFGDAQAADAEWFTVVGIAGDVRGSSLNAEPYAQVYGSYRQSPRRAMTVVLRTAGEPLALAAIVRQQVAALDPQQPLYNMRTAEQVLAASIARPRFNMLLIALLAGIALVLAGIGVYGVISYSVTQRTRELGVRMALGASAGNVLKLVVGEGMFLAGIGIAIGIAAAIGVSRIMASLLYGVTATDPFTFVSLALLLAAIAFVACYIPARRATKVDPMVALRYE
ncbi:MAG: ABC transporter permease [Verrucomicrobiota bacterium]|nr:ABC transporter permease [Verrucomicrobiota bacterium]